MIVMKFGGTSVEDAAAIRRLIEIVKRGRHRKPLVVVSACSGVTNDLIRTAHAVRDGDKDQALNILDRLRIRHRTMAEELLNGKRRTCIFELFDDMFQELRNLVRGVHLLGELTNRSLDTFTSYGEQSSSLIIQGAMEEAGIPSVLVDARSVMVTDKTFTSAKPLVDKIAKRAKATFGPIIKNS